MEISPLFIPLSLSLCLSLSLRYSPLSLWGQFIFSLFEYFKSFNRLTPKIYWVFIYRTPKKTFLNKNYWLIDTLKDNISKKEQNSPELTSRGSNSSGWGHRLGPDQNGCPELVNCYETRTGTSKWFGNSNDWNHCCATVCLPWQTILSGFFPGMHFNFHDWKKKTWPQR